MIRLLRGRSRAASVVLVAAVPAAAVLVLAGTVSGPRGVTQAYRASAGQSGAGTVVTQDSGLAPAACGTARGYDVTDAGTVAWDGKLPGTSGVNGGNGLQPVALDGLAVFAYGNTVSAWRQAGGRLAWKRAYPLPAGRAARSTPAAAAASRDSATGQVGGLWAWHGELIVLIAPTFLGQQPADMRVQALDPATGAVRWTADLGSGDLYNEQTIADGVLALLTETGGSGGRGKLMAVSLSEGRLLWTRPYGQQEETDGPDATGSVVIVAEHGTVTAFDAHTGAPLWSHGRLTGIVGSLPGPDGLALLYALQEPPLPAARVFPVIAVDARTGAVRWRVAAGGPVDELTTVGGQVVIGTSAAYRLTLVNAGGRVAWSAPELVPNNGGWADTGADLVYVSAEPPAAAPGTNQALTRLVDRRRDTGAVRWATRLNDDYGDARVVRPRGASLIAVEGPDLNRSGTTVLAVDPANGKVRAGVTLPLNVDVPPTVAGSDTLLEATVSCAYPGSGAPVAGGSAAAGAPGAGSAPTAPVPGRPPAARARPSSAP